MFKTILSLCLAAVFLGACTSVDPNDFNKETMERFSTVIANVPELGSVTCEADDCRNDINFNFTSNPENVDIFDSPAIDDLLFMIRGNAVTFSNFKKEKTGDGIVTINAIYEGQTVLSCTAINGEADTCTPR